MRKPNPCAKCPKFDVGRRWCCHLAVTRPPQAPSCLYGRKMMHNELAAAYNRRKFGFKKRIPKPHIEEDDEE